MKENYIDSVTITGVFLMALKMNKILVASLSWGLTPSDRFHRWDGIAKPFQMAQQTVLSGLRPHPSMQAPVGNQ